MGCSCRTQLQLSFSKPGCFISLCPETCCYLCHSPTTSCFSPKASCDISYSGNIRAELCPVQHQANRGSAHLSDHCCSDPTNHKTGCSCTQSAVFQLSDILPSLPFPQAAPAVQAPAP